MNNIRFIETLIENIKNYISIGEAELKIYTDIGDDEEFDRTENNLEYLKDRLNILNEIKSKLEAWEVVEEGIEYEEDVPCDERPEYTYKFKKWEFKLTEDDYNFEEKDKKLKKALEVNNNGKL